QEGGLALVAEPGPQPGLGGQHVVAKILMDRRPFLLRPVEIGVEQEFGGGGGIVHWTFPSPSQRFALGPSLSRWERGKQVAAPISPSPRGRGRGPLRSSGRVRGTALLMPPPPPRSSPRRNTCPCATASRPSSSRRARSGGCADPGPRNRAAARHPCWRARNFPCAPPC